MSMPSEQIHIEYNASDGSFVIDARPADLEPILAVLARYSSRVADESAAAQRSTIRRLGSHRGIETASAKEPNERVLASER